MAASGERARACSEAVESDADERAPYDEVPLSPEAPSPGPAAAAAALPAAATPAAVLGPDELRATRVISRRFWVQAVDDRPLPPAAARDLFRALARARAHFYVSPREFGDELDEIDFAAGAVGAAASQGVHQKHQHYEPRALFTRERLDPGLVAAAGLRRAGLDRAYVVLELVTAQGRAVVAAALEFLANEALVRDFDGTQFGIHFLAAFEPTTRLLAHPRLVAKARALQLLPALNRSEYNDFTALHRLSTSLLSADEREYVAATLPELRYALGVFQGPYPN
jgi:hypothetical protein